MHAEPTVELDLTDLSYLGGAVGRADDHRAVFVSGGLPGERVRVEIDEIRKNYLRGHVVEVLSAAAERVTPRCPYVGTCGGCQWQHLDYPAQLRWKTELLRRQLQRIGHFENPPVRPTIAAPNPWSYRNQARFSVDENGNLCFTRAQSHQKVAVATCDILQPELVALMPTLRGAAAAGQSLVARHGSRSGEILIAPRLPALDGTLATGQPYYHEILLGRTYRVSASSFFQVNTRLDNLPRPDLDLSRQGRPDAFDVAWGPSDAIWSAWVGDAAGPVSQAELLTLLVLDRLGLTGVETVVDAYSGVGTFALQIARQARQVIGIEEAPTAVDDATHNAHGFDNVKTLLGRAEEQLASLTVHPDAVVLDPTRLGAAAPVLDALKAVRPETIVYVSCDPATLARDLAALTTDAYDLVDVQPLDMFPQTHHIESVSLLRLNDHSKVDAVEQSAIIGLPVLDAEERG